MFPLASTRYLCRLRCTRAYYDYHAGLHEKTGDQIVLLPCRLHPTRCEHRAKLDVLQALQSARIERRAHPLPPCTAAAAAAAATRRSKRKKAPADESPVAVAAPVQDGENDLATDFRPRRRLLSAESRRRGLAARIAPFPLEVGIHRRRGAVYQTQLSRSRR